VQVLTIEVIMTAVTFCRLRSAAVAISRAASLRSRRLNVWAVVALIPLLLCGYARGDEETPRPLQRLADLLPPPISDELYLEGWVWLGDLQNNAHPPSNYYDVVFSLALTKSFDQRVAVTAQGNYINANGTNRAELEQGFVSARVFEPTETLLTVGKFNANFGVEPRDFWNRRTGTTSLLFGAQPQDLIGFMMTQPIGNTGVKLRPFMSADFQGAWNFDQPPSGGLVTEYQPKKDLRFSLTNWVGPGFVLYGGKPLRPPYPIDSYGSEGTFVVENWQGPNLVAERGSTLYFVDANMTWRVRPDLSLSLEYLWGRTGTSSGPWGWSGWMVLLDYSITDRVHIWGRYSALDDSDWIITGLFMKASEVSCGIGWEIHDGVEIRVEYRHDFSNVTPDFDSVSIHLTMAF
jgi:hypothetical protein